MRELADVGRAAIAMIVGARGTLDRVNAERLRRYVASVPPKEQLGVPPPALEPPPQFKRHVSLVKVAIRAERERCAMIAENVAGAASRANPRGAAARTCRSYSANFLEARLPGLICGWGRWSPRSRFETWCTQPAKPLRDGGFPVGEHVT
jgi:hypothetical protein